MVLSRNGKRMAPQLHLPGDGYVSGKTRTKSGVSPEFCDKGLHHQCRVFAAWKSVILTERVFGEAWKSLN
ncbi:hypothetical protein TWF106_002357 [Orbilia oligospora]|uniref:Uncharacterized protein n=1 Tax=Orbilia oligospora TaxID=2813651 RepID=A0A6G1MGE8_ORBOL|nr:hypothetical protein TWF106_002357 [Orbilia oligospora]KAF3209563.1 hypothetical protein TWF679_007387 [Orbilia oligospora]KAF3220891.1 hypothetical protein TWF191_007350 [Orbilia oligospora]KAF3257058.1 hypothetical protein TWF192_001340 [Orbilia oligospora]